MHVSMHIHPELGGILDVSSQYLCDVGETHAEIVSVKIRVGADDVILFLDTIEDVDKLAFEFETLARTLRDEHGWTQKESTENV
jgi:hypothetical protein